MSKSSNRKRRSRKAGLAARHSLGDPRPSDAWGREQERHPVLASLSGWFAHRPGWVRSGGLTEVNGDDIWCYEPSRRPADIFAPNPSATAVSWYTRDPRDGLLVEPPTLNGQASPHQRVYETLRCTDRGR